MSISVLTTVFYVIMWLILGSAFFLWKKSEKELSSVTWLAITIVGMRCSHTTIAGIIQVIHIPVNIISLGCIDGMMGLILWFFIFKKKQIQTYKTQVVDVLLLGLLAVFSILFLKQRYGFDLNLHYATIDPAAHLQSAMDVIKHQKVSCMYYASLNTALLIEAIGAFIHPSNYYKIFVLNEVIQLFLSGWIFYGITKRYAKDIFTKVVAIVLTFVYIGGFPLNNAIYGYNYLGMGVTVVGFLIILTDTYLHEEVNRKWNVFLMMLGCVGIFESYVLFMPVTFFAIFAAINVKQLQNKKLISMDTVLLNLAVFLLPCMIGLYYTYLGIFSGGTTVSGAIANEGAIYRDLFSNFLPFLPLAIYGFVESIKEKKNHILMYLLPFLSVFVFVLFIMVEKGKASTYYFYKNYFLMWLLVLAMMYYGISNAQIQLRKMMVCFFGVWLGVFAIWFTRVEDKIQSRNAYIDPVVKSVAFNDLFEHNYQYMFVVPGYSLEKMDLYQYVANNLIATGLTDEVPGAVYWEDNFWYEAIIDQRIKGFDYWNNSQDQFFENLPHEDYVLVLFDSPIYQENSEYFNSLERIYANNIGFVGKVK